MLSRPIALVVAPVAAVLLLALLGSPASPDPAQAGATFVVDSTVDATDVVPGDGVCADGSGNCTLRAAVMEANALAGADTITLPAGAYTLTTVGTDEDLTATGDLDITEDLTINGAGMASTTIDADKTDRVFDVDPAGSGGTVLISGVTIQGGSPGHSGGGIRNGGALTLANSTVSDNLASFGGGIFNASGGEVHLNSSQVTGNSSTGNGGGIGNAGGGTLTLTNSGVTGNTAANYGGGINSSGDVTLTDSTVSGNTATTFGGGGFESQGVLTITNSTISGNTAATRGGGIDNVEGAQATIIDSTISGNSGGDEGGGIFMEDTATMTMTGSTLSSNSATAGGGLRVNTGAATLANSTVSANTASFGGGIYNGENATTTLINVTITHNSALTNGGGLYNPGDAPGAFMLTNTIVADQQLGEDCGGSGTFVTQGNNLDSDNTCDLNPGTDVPNGSANLGPLADNGGLTETHALLLGSDAIDAGDDTDCVAPPVDGLDQRGVTRPQGAQCDIGAFELEVATPTPSPTPSPTATPTPTPTPTPTTSPSPTPPPSGQQTWGDVDCDGTVGTRDSQALLRNVLEQPALSQTGDCPLIGAPITVDGNDGVWGDVDCDGTVGTRDSQALLRNVLEQPALSQTPPCPLIGDLVQVSD